MNDIDQIRKAVDRMGPGELKSCLRLLLHQIRMLKEQTPNPGSTAAELIGLYDALMNRKDERHAWDPAPGCTHVHIVTGDSFAGGMKLALRELGLADTHKIVAIRDNLAIGPVARLDTSEGRRARQDWFRDNIASAALGEDDDPEEANRRLMHQIDQIPAQAEIIVWTSSSAIEQTGMRYAMHLIRGKTNPVRVCDACAICGELERRPDHASTYTRSGEIGPDKLQVAIRRAEDAEPLSADDIRRLAGEWTAIAERDGVLRIWRDGEVRTVPADHFDAHMLEMLDKAAHAADADGYVRAARVVGEAVGYADQDIGDDYFEYRLRELVYAGVLEIRGIPAGLRYYSVRRKRRTPHAPA